MTDLLAPGREVLYKLYHTGELSLPTVPEPDWDATAARAEKKKGPKPRVHDGYVAPAVSGTPQQRRVMWTYSP